MDALGNKVKEGEYYGYSRNHNGYTHTVIGVVTRVVDDTYAVLKPMYKIEALYENRPQVEETKARGIRMKSMSLFPVDIEKLNRELYDDTASN